MRSFSFFHGELERNWANSHVDPSARKAVIDQMPNPALRVGESLLLAAALRSPRATARVLGRELPTGYQFLDAGSQHTIVRREQEVVKIHRESCFMTPEEREKLAARQQNNHRILKKFLSLTTEPQTTVIAPNPLNPTTTAIQHIQGYKANDALPIFSPYGNGIDEAALERAIELAPDNDRAFNQIAVAGLHLVNNHDMAPDITGPGNISADISGSIVLLDSLPVTGREDARGVDRIGNVLENLVKLV